MGGSINTSGLRLKAFSDWMTENSKTLGQNSIGKYTGAVRTISKDMLAAGVIDKDLVLMPVDELDAAISRILANEAFIQKNTTGNHMYSNALKQFRFFSNSTVDPNETLVADLAKVNNDKTINQTERQALTKARIGQGKFRDSLLEKYEGKCIVTGIDVQQILTASHVKPWSVSSNEERLSVNNGLLLSASFDRLFDNGLITFDPLGKLFISSFISEYNRMLLGIKEGMVFDIKANEELRLNLEYHNDVVYVK